MDLSIGSIANNFDQFKKSGRILYDKYHKFLLKICTESVFYVIIKSSFMRGFMD